MHYLEFDLNDWLDIDSGALWYGHACMRGSDPIITDELYLGTAKSIEGDLAGVLFEKAKEEGSGFFFREFILCCVHFLNKLKSDGVWWACIGRAYAKALKDLRRSLTQVTLLSTRRSFLMLKKLPAVAKGRDIQQSVVA